MSFSFPTLKATDTPEQVPSVARQPNNADAHSMPPPPTTNPLLANATVRHTNAAAQQDTGAPIVPVRVASGVSPARRAKVPLEKGFSQVAWLHLARGSNDLAGTGGRRRPVTMQQVRQHNTAEDGWVVLRGKVYNITPYLKYHPGGVRILAALAGKDCTAQFNRYHAWVNGDALLAACLVGPLVPDSKDEEEGGKQDGG